MLQFKIKIKYYLIFGVAVFNILTGILYIIQLKNNLLLEDKYYFLFYIAILFENIAFSLALGKKERELFLEKEKFQAEYIKELNQNQDLRRNLNEKLKNEIDIKTNELELANKQLLQENKEKLIIEFEHIKHKLNLKSLQNQMNPHFIFNALNSIKAYLIENDKENGIYYLNKFSKLIRGILDGMRTEKITLQQEINLLETYIKIENIRLNNELEFTFCNASNLNLESIYIPPLLLQPLIENAILHGFTDNIEDKKITIEVDQKKNNTYISITDNGIGVAHAIKKTSISRASYGLKLVEERLNLFNLSNNQNFEKLNITDLSSLGYQGTRVIIRLN